MGACCSCQRGGRFESFFVDEEEQKRNIEDEDIVLRGDSGARIRLQGSSKYVSMYSQQGKKGVNQDAMTVWESFSGDKDMFYCGVFDGHGPSGHKVARYVRDLLPAKISTLYKQASTDGKNGALDIVDANDDVRENPFFLSWKARLIKCFEEMDEQLEGDSSIESYCSGTTSVSVLKKGEHLIISNLGDSRAVLCTRDENNQLVSEQLTVDLKPNLPNEAERIRSRQGRVLAMEEEPNVYRIWMPQEDCPGLAMARAFGDFCLKDFGLISTPEVTYRKLTERDEFVVLATDGIWDVLSNNEVVKIVASARKRSLAAKLLIEKAVRAWRYKYPCARIDDCAVVCLFFKRPRPLLTKSVSEVTHLSLNYAELAASGHVAKSDDGLDTVLNCNVNGSPEGDEKGGDGSDSAVKRLRKRRPGKKLEHGGE
ncbi:hypothetical protein RD792_011022 [Penstemon davidsonii]|uniref:PPM-type phosphatase domain-containing protein n=1 Tax=Penstemon davidsonii TaxID=160366 RepID=A0ABR0D3L9_9LAMI|nr:hypothetical protein RD792_011022 [Penstemon davidsonii]